MLSASDLSGFLDSINISIWDTVVQFWPQIMKVAAIVFALSFAFRFIRGMISSR